MNYFWARESQLNTVAWATPVNFSQERFSLQFLCNQLWSCLSFSFDFNQKSYNNSNTNSSYLSFSWSYINFLFSTASGKYWRGSQERNSEGHLDSFYSYSSPKPSWEMEVSAPCFVRMPNRLACVDMTNSSNDIARFRAMKQTNSSDLTLHEALQPRSTTQAGV